MSHDSEKEIEFSCPNCSTTIRAPLSATGFFRNCPSCDESAEVPLKIPMGGNPSRNKTHPPHNSQLPMPKPVSQTTTQAPAREPMSKAAQVSPKQEPTEPNQPEGESTSNGLFLYIVFAVVAVAAAGTGWYATSERPEQPTEGEIALNDVNARIELIVRRWQAAQRSLEEVKTLEVTIAEWTAADYQNLLPNARSALLMHEGNLKRDRDSMVDALCALAATQHEQSGVVEDGLRRALESAKAGYRLDEQGTLEELLDILPAPQDQAPEAYFTNLLDRRFDL